MQINSSRRGHLPPVAPAEPLVRGDGSVRGWRLTLPAGCPLATPAVVDGRVFLGAGFGTYEFYCLDAGSGKLLWQYQTSDDGPTAAVVADGYVVFNTESCELEVLTASGESVWKHWLGDPLMSMPAVGDGRVFMAYPDSRHDHQHYLACFDIRDGRRLWRTQITGEVITAPVLADGNVYFATLDGTLFCCSQEDGSVRWREASRATSSPVVVNGRCHFSQREAMRSSGAEDVVQQMEYFAMRSSEPQAETKAYRSSRRKADYLDHSKRRVSSPLYMQMAMHDAAVGFATSKGSSKMHQAMRNLGRSNVAGIWAYQGSKPFFRYGRLYASLGDTVNCVSNETDAVLWKRRLRDDESEQPVDSVVTPPALVNNKAFVGTATGDVYALCTETGEVLWQERVDAPVDFQLAVMQGRVYVPTRAGSLFCLETGDPDDDGWAMWGATPAHNGVAEDECAVAD